MAERRLSQWRNLGLAAPVIFAANRVRRPRLSSWHPSVVCGASPSRASPPAP